MFDDGLVRVGEIKATSASYVQRIDGKELVKAATTRGWLVRYLVRAGSPVATGDTRWRWCMARPGAKCQTTRN